MKAFRVALLLGAFASNLFPAEMPANLLTFNGKDLDGWESIAGGRFYVENKTLRMEGGPGILFYSFPQYSGAGHLHLEFKVAGAKGEAAVILRMSGPPSSVAARDGYKIWISANRDAKRCTGAIDGGSPATVCRQKPSGEWNTMDVWMGGFISVLANGAEVNQAAADQTGRFYAIENDGAGSTISFRSITFSPNFN